MNTAVGEELELESKDQLFGMHHCSLSNKSPEMNILGLKEK